jgi:DNA-binding Xre family transcriptional regulator
MTPRGGSGEHVKYSGDAGTPHTKTAQQLGIAKSSLHRIEMGEQNVGLDLLEHLCRRLHCTLADLFPHRDEPWQP